MEQHWLVKNGNPNLVVFALGWSCDCNSVAHLAERGYDIFCVYDYRNIDRVDAAQFADYKQKVLVGWSFGVWAAEQIFSAEDFDRTIAINGTPYPIDSTRGIPQRVANLTLRALKSGGIEQFNLNTYGTLCQTNSEILPQRELASQVEELERLYEQIAARPYAEFGWHRAIVGNGDRIFPVANQLNFWGEGAVVTQSPHYPFLDSQTLDIIFER